MGRVYNALLKADRLTGGGRAIRTAASLAPAAKDTATVPVKRARIKAGENPPTDFSFNHDSAASAPVFQSDRNLSLTETFAAPRKAEPRQIANVKSLTTDPRLVALTGTDALAQQRYRTLAVRVVNAASRRKLKSLVINGRTH